MSDKPQGLDQLVGKYYRTPDDCTGKILAVAAPGILLLDLGKPYLGFKRVEDMLGWMFYAPSAAPEPEREPHLMLSADYWAHSKTSGGLIKWTYTVREVAEMYRMTVREVRDAIKETVGCCFTSLTCPNCSATELCTPYVHSRHALTENPLGIADHECPLDEEEVQDTGAQLTQ